MLHNSTFNTAFNPSMLRSHAYDTHDSQPALLFRAPRQDAPPLESQALLKGHKIVEIVHNGSLYKLQATKLGKLILTK